MNYKLWYKTQGDIFELNISNLENVYLYFNMDLHLNIELSIKCDAFINVYCNILS